ncbi:hypothetical protein [Paraburkholderia terrae]|uniref:hypothetical protein n=1 Tax=Paraburkholderia terrae TaxID=311230 RepID=UPI0020BD5378|nr:hypothetical protein [Paraburkholderia terrae]
MLIERTDDAHCDSICAIFTVSAVMPPMMPALPTKLAISEIAPLFELKPAAIELPRLFNFPLFACACNLERLFVTCAIGPDA